MLTSLSLPLSPPRRSAAVHVASLIGLIAFAFAGGLGCASDKQVRTQANTLHDQLKPAIVHDTDVDGYLKQVGDRIVSAARQLDAEGYMVPGHDKEGKNNAWMFSDSIQFHLVNVDEVNAVSTGGDHMYIYNKFFQECQSEDELAAVMAHEFGHVYARHIHQKMDRGGMVQVGSGLAAIGGALLAEKNMKNASQEEKDKVSQDMASMAGGAGTVLAAGFTREDEDTADKAGFAFYVRAGYDPNKFADLFRNQLDKAGANAPSAKPSYLDDHPTLKQRVENTEKRIAALGPDAERYRQPTVASLVRFRKLQEEANDICAKQPQSTALASAKQMLSGFSSCFSHVDETKKGAPTTQPGSAIAQGTNKKAAAGQSNQQLTPQQQQQLRQQQQLYQQQQLEQQRQMQEYQRQLQQPPAR